MKKIVALVLSLVMVLGLATTAFAATTSTGSVVKTSVTVKNPALYTLGNAQTGVGKAEVPATITDIEKTTVSGKVVDDVAMYVPNVYAIDGVGVFVEVAQASAGYELKNNGVSVYLAAALGCADADDAVEKYATDVVMAQFVAPVEVVKCGDDTKQLPYWVSADGDLYYAVGNDYAYMNGAFVAYNAASKNAVALKPHTWVADNVTYRGVDALGVKVPVSIKCDKCDEPFAIVGAAGFNNTWVEGVNYVKYPFGGAYYIVLDAGVKGPAGDAEDNTVESPKTFDAGIAMYVGMSVMAAAGSAVVLKKKD